VHASYKTSTEYTACKLGKYDTRFIPTLPKSFAKPTVNPKLSGKESYARSLISAKV